MPGSVTIRAELQAAIAQVEAGMTQCPLKAIGLPLQQIQSFWAIGVDIHLDLPIGEVNADRQISQFRRP